MLEINPHLNDLAAEARSGLQDCFGVEAGTMATAPGRVNLIGEHIDYCDGFALPFAIDRHTVMAARVREDDEVRIATQSDNARVNFDVGAPIVGGRPGWGNYLRGVARGFQDLGYKLPGFDAYITSSIPMGAGLSSSAALTSAMATLLEGLLDTRLKAREKALLCQRVEHNFAGVPCGIMDTFTLAYGRQNQLILIDCLSGNPALIPFDNTNITVLVSNTMVRHKLSDAAYAERREQTEQGLMILDKPSWRDVTAEDVEANWKQLGEPINRRARHVVSEITRTLTAAEAIAHNEYEILKRLMAASHDSLRNDFEVSCKELDTMVDIARGIGREGGVVGSRMTGAGFGGSTVTLCDSSKASAIADTLANEFEKATGIPPQIFATRPCEGARLL